MPSITPPDWLNLNLIQTAVKAEVSSYDVATMGGTGDGYTSSLLKVKVELKNGEQLFLILKRLVEVENTSNWLNESTMFPKEIHAYSVVLPKLEALLRKALPGEEGLIAPRHFYSKPGLLVIEDLCASGFKMLDRHEGLDLNHSLQVVRNLAKFHAVSVILHQQDPDCMKLFDKSLFSEPCIIKNMHTFSKSMTSIFADEIAKWPEYGEKYATKFRLMIPKMVAMTAWSARREEERFNVLTHDDMWINNVMFRDPEDVRFIDFQMPHFASPGNDLQLFTAMSLTDEVWDNHIPTLLKEYHSTLCNTLTALGYSKKLISLKDLREEYDRSSLYGMLISVVYLPAVLSPPDYEVPMFGGESAVLDNSVYNNSKFREKIRKMIREYEKQGAFDLVDKFYSSS